MNFQFFQRFSPGFLLLIVALVTAPQTVLAQWSVSYLHPSVPDAANSFAYSTAYGTVGGAVFLGPTSTPAFWSDGTAASYSRLGPISTVASAVRTVGDGIQAGFTNSWAQYWRGGSEEFYLETENSLTTSIAASSNGWVGGQLQPTESDPIIAAIWKLTDDSSEHPILLRSVGTEASAVYAMSGATNVTPGSQAGMVSAGEGERQAALWQGTSESYTNLHPSGAVESVATAIHGSRQAGFVRLEGEVFHAAVWSGTAASFEDYNPGGAFTDSRIYSAAEGVFAGRGWVGDDTVLDSRALVWFDGVPDPLNLHSMLPEKFEGSNAESISWVGSELWVAGWAYNVDDLRYEALLWTYSIPEPSTTFLFIAGLGGVFFTTLRTKIARSIRG